MLKFFLKAFLSFLLIFGLVYVLIDVATGSPSGLKNSLISASFMALFFALILGAAHYYGVKKQLKRKPEYHDLKTVQKIQLQLGYNLEELAEKLKENPLVKGKRPLIENAKIRLSMPWSHDNWGEYIDIEPLEDKDGYYLIKSRPKLRATIFDFGKNLKNLQQLEEHLKKLEDFKKA